MHLTAYLGLLFGLLATLALAGYAIWSAWQENDGALCVLERGHLAATLLVLASSGILTWALMTKNYSFLYVYEHVDSLLDPFYTASAFWAGKEGSLLFWSLSMMVMGAIFAMSAGYEELTPRTRLYYWIFFQVIQGFFLLLLTSWSNPFIEVAPRPADGHGLNPLLQNPGMIFHPPLLLLGYAGFSVPAAAALASILSGEPRSWIKATRNWTLLAWVYLTGGIILGGWWSYMELGWGGYWAWDPVENASLIPWFTGTAFLHTAIIEARRGALQRSNILLMSLTFLLCVFGTYLVRSGVIDSLHAFGEGGVGTPLMWFMIFWSAASLMAVLLGEKPVYRALSSLATRQGLLLVAAWFLLALGLVVAMATMWPVISKMWSPKPVGLGPDFYNRVCLPLMALVVLIFAVCPWLGWKEGLRDRRGLLAAAAVFAAASIGLAATGMTKPLALFTAAASVAGMAAWLFLPLFLPALRSLRQSWGTVLVHLGVAVMALGIAFSGPYKVEKEFSLKPGGATEIDGYNIAFVDMAQDQTNAMSWVRTRLAVTRAGKSVGELLPERRVYRNAESAFAEASTIPGLGDELYATLLGFSDETTATFKVSVNPLVNWVWIGGTVLSLAPLLLLRRRRSEA